MEPAQQSDLIRVKERLELLEMLVTGSVYRDGLIDDINQLKEQSSERVETLNAISRKIDFLGAVLATVVIVLTVEVMIVWLIG